MKRLLNKIFQLEEISGDGICPTYLYRWTLFRAGDYAIYLHKFVGDDWSRDMHDHPKKFISIGLKGWYVEHKPWTIGISGAEVLRVWEAPWIRSFPPTHIHRITGPTPEKPCWTLVIVGRAVRPWGFWRRNGLETEWIPWHRYVTSTIANMRKSCQ